MAAGVERHRFALALAALFAPGFFASSAQADPSQSDLRAARQLFLEAEKDEDQSHWAEALEKFRHVAEVRRTAGVRYHVALCEEHAGQLAVALDEYTSAEGQAREENAQDVLRLVGKRIADLGPRVPRLTIRVVPDAPGTTVTLDAAKLPLAVLGTALPVDPGEHRVEASAPARTPATQVVTLRERDVTSIELKLPQEATAAPTPPTETPAAPQATATASPPPLPTVETPRVASSSPPRAAAILTTTGAVVLVAAGVGAYLLAGSALDSGIAICEQNHSPSSSACSPQKNAVHAWDFAAGGMWVGAAAVGTVAIVLWTRPEHSSPSAKLFVGPGALGFEERF